MTDDEIAAAVRAITTQLQSIPGRGWTPKQAAAFQILDGLHRFLIEQAVPAPGQKIMTFDDYFGTRDKKPIQTANKPEQTTPPPTQTQPKATPPGQPQPSPKEKQEPYNLLRNQPAANKKKK